MTRTTRFWAHTAPALICLGASCVQADVSPQTDGDRPPLRITQPPSEFPTAFSVIRAVMALPDGRLVVSDAQDNRVLLVNFDKGTSLELGRIGEGPREYRRVGGLFRARGGGVAVFDQGLRRLLPVSPSGALKDVTGLPTGGAAGPWSARGPDFLSVDTLGHTYVALREGGFAARTSSLLRYVPGLPPDTVAHLLRTLTLPLKSEGAQGYQEVLFSPADAWAVSADGYIGIVRATPYRIEWISPDGAAVSGPIIRYKPVRVTQAEKERIASGLAGPRGRFEVTMGMLPAGATAASGSTQPEPIPVDELLFAKDKPPLNLRSGSWPLIDESGRLWAERTLPPDGSVVVLDVFDRTGILVDRVQLPPGSRLVGFDRQWIYAARTDADDLEHLRRFPMPAPLASR